jgi:hypothetical protein
MKFISKLAFSALMIGLLVSGFKSKEAGEGTLMGNAEGTKFCCAAGTNGCEAAPCPKQIQQMY